MCGFLGIFGVETEIDWVSKNLHQLIDRGPDNQSLAKVDFHCSLGASRLAMVDPQPRSNQPFTDGKYWLCFNGEIYNHEDLREKLEKDYVFETQSDTEVLFVMLLRFGVGALDEINGMFSFAFYDSSQVKLLLGRDSLGKKPLYYSLYQDKVFFSSKRELIPKQEKSHCDASENSRYIYSYLKLGFLIDPLTPDVFHNAIEPGTVMQFELENDQKPSKIQIKQINLEVSSYRRKLISRRASLDLRQLLTNAVIARTKGHSNVGLSLSGGVDSAILAIILRDIGISARAYSAYWPDADKVRYNFDYKKAEQVASQLKHTFCPVEVVSSYEIPNQVERYLNMMQEPNNNPTGLSMISIYEKIANDGVRLALTGDGGDEFFGGYSRYSSYLKYKKLGLICEVSALFQKLNFLNFRLGSELHKLETFNNWAYWHETFTEKEMEEITNFKKSQLEDLQNELNQEFCLKISKYGKNTLKTLMYLDQSYWLSMESNRRLDRVSMAFSVEARSPFQDDVIREMFLDKEEGRLRRNLGKKELVNAFPELAKLGVLEEKMGFVSPMGHWLRQNQTDVISEIKSLSMRKEFAHLSNLEVPTILISGNFAKIKQIWTLYILGKWFTRIDNRL